MTPVSPASGGSSSIPQADALVNPPQSALDAIRLDLVITDSEVVAELAHFGGQVAATILAVRAVHDQRKRVHLFAIDQDIERHCNPSLLASNQAFTQGFLDSTQTTLKGFHPMEYLLFGANGAKIPSDFTPREKEYLIAEALSIRHVLSLDEMREVVGIKTVHPIVKSLLDKQVIYIEQLLVEKYKPTKTHLSF